MAYRYRYRRALRYRRYRRRRGYRSRFTRKLARSLSQKDTCRLILSSKPELISGQFVQVGGSGSIVSQTAIKVINPMLLLVGWTSNAQTPVTTPGLAAFERFRVLFDQFKVNAIRVKLQIVSQPSGNGMNSAIVVRSAIDRNGVAPVFNAALNAQTVSDPTTIATADTTFESYSSFNTKIINSSDLYSLYRTFYPIGREKGQWYGASFNYSGLSQATDANISDIIYPFRPILMLQFMCSNLSPQNPFYENYNVSFDYDITFKGQRNLSS